MVTTICGSDTADRTGRITGWVLDQVAVRLGLSYGQCEASEGSKSAEADVIELSDCLKPHRSCPYLYIYIYIFNHENVLVELN